MSLNFSISSILAGLLFGGIGFVAFSYGKKQGLPAPMIIGISLMAYPYFITNTIATYAIGIVLTALLFIFKN